MRSACCILALLLVGACSGQPQNSPTPCPGSRPQVCTMEYKPTCAVLIDGGRREYSSPCNACADDRVAATLSGPCPE